MLFYLILLFILTLLGYLLCNKTEFKYRNGLFVAIAFGVLCFLSCIRYDVGMDYMQGGYTQMWYNVQNTPISDFMSLDDEFGYTLFMYMFKFLGKNYQMVYVITSVLIAVLSGLFIYKYAKDKVWAFFLYYGLGMFYCSTNLLRQTISCLIFVFAIECAKKKKLIPYLLITLLAASFHKSALVMLPVYFLLQINLTNVVLAVYSVLSVGVFFASPYIVKFVSKFWYGSYLNSYHIQDGNSYFYLIVPLIFFIILYTFKDKICRADKTNMVYINCAFFNLFFYFISCHHRLVDRFTMFFEPAVILGICVLMKAFNDEKKEKDITRQQKSKTAKTQLITGAIVVAAAMTINMVYLIEDGHAIIPYRTIFNDDYRAYCQSLEGYDNIIEEPEF